MAKLIMTVEQMQDREKWLDARRHGIGGSDAAAVVGLNKWKSPFALWLEKTGQSEPDDLSDNERVYWGTVLEETVAREFTRRTGKKVARRGVLQHEEHPFMLASVDRMIVGEDAGLECKTANSLAAKEWDGDHLPDAYYVQCQHYMMVTGCATWYIAALIGGNQYIWKEVPRNEDDISALMKAEMEFWLKVEAREMPDVDGSESCAKALAEKYHGGGDVIELPTDAESIFIHLDELQESKNALEEAIEEYKNRLRLMLGDAEEGTVNGRRVTWKTQAGRWTVDGKRLKEDLPKLYAKYARQGKPSRVLRIT